MTRQKHIRIVERTLRRWFPTEEDETIRRAAEGIVNRVQEEIEDELEEQQQGVVVDFDAVRQVAPRPMEEALPPPPPDNPHPSLIVDPTSPEAKEQPRFRANRASLKLPTPTRSNSKLTQDDLRDYIYKNTPDPLYVRVEGRADPVPLARNVIVQVGCDTVKLIYGLADRNQPTSSAPNSPDGEMLTAMSVDTPIAATLSIDRMPNMPQILKQLADTARSTFKPKPDHLASATPRRAGTLTFRPDDPHEEVGPMTNPVNGRVW